VRIHSNSSRRRVRSSRSAPKKTRIPPIFRSSCLAKMVWQNRCNTWCLRTDREEIPRALKRSLQAIGVEARLHVRARWVDCQNTRSRSHGFARSNEVAFTVWAGAMALAMGSAYAQDAQATANPSAAVAALAPAPIEDDPTTEAQGTGDRPRPTRKLPARIASPANRRLANDSIARRTCRRGWRS
jgi:hypothetical protein